MKKIFLLILLICLVPQLSTSLAQNPNQLTCWQKFDWHPMSNTLVLKDNQTVTVYNLAQNIIIFQHEFANPVLDVKMTNDGQHLVVVEENYVITLWNIKTQTEKTKLDFSKYMENSGFQSHAISDNGHYVYVAFWYPENRYANIWDIQNDVELYQGQKVLKQPIFAPVDTFIFALDHFTSSWGIGNGLMYVWNWRVQGENWHDVGSASRGSFFDIQFAPRMNRLAVHYSNTIMFWRIYSYKYILLGYREFELTISPSQFISQVVWHPSADKVATVITESESYYVKIWDSENGALLEVYPEQPSQVYKLYFSEDDILLAVGCSANTWFVWNTETLETVNSVTVQADN